MTRQWNADGNPIEGATGATYEIIERDEGVEITLTVTATNSAGSTSETSAATDPVEPMEAPTNTVEPSIDGTPAVGQTLTAVNGTWTGEPSFSYVWLADAVAIPDETGSTLELTSDYVGQAISVAVTATNAACSLSVTSAATDPVAAGG